jgi:hypothetical protein
MSDVTEGTEHLDLSVTVGGASFTGTGPADRVMAALERFSALVAEYGVAPPAGTSGEQAAADAAGAGETDEPAAAATPPQESAASKVPLPRFLESDAIKGNSKIATAIVVWAADHEQKDGLTTGEIEKYWKSTKLKVPRNTSRDIGAAVKEGWLHRDGRTLSATGYGREAIGLSAS